MSRSTILAAVLGLWLAAGPACADRAVTLDIATTTSVQNSGLLGALLPHFERAVVRVHAAGSGRALAMLSDDVVDLVISHAPAAEARALADHPAWSYRKIAHNRFVIVGPADDPAGIRDAAEAPEAFRRIARAPVTFVSRGDESGTHERELSLWKEAGVTPPADRWLVSGRSMAMALRHADERRGYTLSDEATYLQLRGELELVVLFAGDARLLNTYAVVYPRSDREAEAFADWLVSGDGRGRIEGYRVQGQAVFTVWPLACPGEAPAALPCGG